MQFDRAKSIVRYFPPKGTAGLECQRVRLCSRVPAPPARISERVFLVSLKVNEFAVGMLTLARWNVCVCSIAIVIMIYFRLQLYEHLSAENYFSFIWMLNTEGEMYIKMACSFYITPLFF